MNRERRFRELDRLIVHGPFEARGPDRQNWPMPRSGTSWEKRRAKYLRATGRYEQLEQELPTLRRLA